jgi:cytochrome c biogenesis protein CcdA/thiol-disulfide isomerase/thioredoxin
MALLIVSFVAGALTVLAPCVLPLLPVIIGGSVTGAPSTRRALTITTALAASVFVFTIVLKVSTAFIGIPQNVWEWISGTILVLVGLFMVFPQLWDSIVPPSLNISGNRMMAEGNAKQSFWGDVLIGAALGPVFSSCSPTYFILLATVLPVHFLAGLVYLIVYCIGLALMLGLVAIAGQRIMNALGWASDPKGWVKRLIGAIFVVLGVLIFFGIDKQLEAALPASAFGIANIETQILQLTHAVDSGQGAQGLMPDDHMGMMATDTAMMGDSATSSAPASATTLAKKAMIYPKEPNFPPGDAYINTDGQPISLAQYKGKSVVLVDFWTYSCINCIRTLPYVESWYQKYKDQGLVIIGVHTPEFAFEHVLSNVQDASKRLGVTYPVVLDNEYKIWNAFGNQYWPAEYLIDIDGYVVHQQFGEGDYDVTEKAIQDALAERAKRLGMPTADIAKPTSSFPGNDLRVVYSPETYFGASRNEYLGNGTPSSVGSRTFTLPDTPRTNTLYLGGTWDVELEQATGNKGAQVLYSYNAHNVFFVASGASGTAVVQVLRDGKPLGSFAGADVNAKDSTVTITGQRLYDLIDDAASGPHTIELKVLSGSLAAYTFTFG